MVVASHLLFLVGVSGVVWGYQWPDDGLPSVTDCRNKFGGGVLGDGLSAYYIFRPGSNSWERGEEVSLLGMEDLRVHILDNDDGTCPDDRPPYPLDNFALACMASYIIREKESSNSLRSDYYDSSAYKVTLTLKTPYFAMDRADSTTRNTNDKDDGRHFKSASAAFCQDKCQGSSTCGLLRLGNTGNIYAKHCFVQKQDGAKHAHPFDGWILDDSYLPAPDDDSFIKLGEGVDPVMETGVSSQFWRVEDCEDCDQINSTCDFVKIPGKCFRVTDSDDGNGFVAMNSFYDGMLPPNAELTGMEVLANNPSAKAEGIVTVRGRKVPDPRDRKEQWGTTISKYIDGLTDVMEPWNTLISGVTCGATTCACTSSSCPYGNFFSKYKYLYDDGAMMTLRCKDRDCEITDVRYSWDKEEEDWSRPRHTTAMCPSAPVDDDDDEKDVKDDATITLTADAALSVKEGEELIIGCSFTRCTGLERAPVRIDFFINRAKVYQFEAMPSGRSMPFSATDNGQGNNIARTSSSDGDCSIKISNFPLRFAGEIRAASYSHYNSYLAISNIVQIFIPQYTLTILSEPGSRIRLEGDFSLECQYFLEDVPARFLGVEVRWYFDGDMIAECLRDGAVSYDHVRDGHSFANDRPCQSGDGSLQFEDTEESSFHHGEYTCEVRDGGAQVRSLVHEVQVSQYYIEPKGNTDLLIDGATTSGDHSYSAQLHFLTVMPSSADTLSGKYLAVVKCESSPCEEKPDNVLAKCSLSSISTEDGPSSSCTSVLGAVVYEKADNAEQKFEGRVAHSVSWSLSPIEPGFYALVYSGAIVPDTNLGFTFTSIACSVGSLASPEDKRVLRDEAVDPPREYIQVGRSDFQLDAVSAACSGTDSIHYSWFKEQDPVDEDGNLQVTNSNTRLFFQDDFTTDANYEAVYRVKVYHPVDYPVDTNVEVQASVQLKLVQKPKVTTTNNLQSGFIQSFISLPCSFTHGYRFDGFTQYNIDFIRRSGDSRPLGTAVNDAWGCNKIAEYRKSATDWFSNCTRLNWATNEITSSSYTLATVMSYPIVNELVSKDLTISVPGNLIAPTEGIYDVMCRVEDNLGNKGDSSFQVEIVAAGVIFISLEQETVSAYMDNQAVTLSCTYMGYFEDSSDNMRIVKGSDVVVDWFKIGTGVTRSGRYRLPSVKGDCTFSIESITLDDSGEYMIYIESTLPNNSPNEYDPGDNKASVAQVFNVYELISVTSPQAASVTEGDSLMVSCDFTGGNSLANKRGFWVWCDDDVSWDSCHIDTPIYSIDTFNDVVSGEFYNKDPEKGFMYRNALMRQNKATLYIYNSQLGYDGVLGCYITDLDSTGAEAYDFPDNFNLVRLTVDPFFPEITNIDPTALSLTEADTLQSITCEFEMSQYYYDNLEPQVEWKVAEGYKILSYYLTGSDDSGDCTSDKVSYGLSATGALYSAPEFTVSCGVPGRSVLTVNSTGGLDTEEYFCVLLNETEVWTSASSSFEKLQVFVDNTTIKVKYGSTIVLPCSYSTQKTVVEIVWWQIKGNVTRLIYAYILNSDRGLMSEIGHVFDSTRVSVSPAMQDATLTVRDLRLEDSGVYRCAVYDTGSSYYETRDMDDIRVEVGRCHFNRHRAASGCGQYGYCTDLGECMCYKGFMRNEEDEECQNCNHPSLACPDTSECVYDASILEYACRCPYGQLLAFNQTCVDCQEDADCGQGEGCFRLKHGSNLCYPLCSSDLDCDVGQTIKICTVPPPLRQDDKRRACLCQEDYEVGRDKACFPLASRITCYSCEEDERCARAQHPSSNHYTMCEQGEVCETRMMALNTTIDLTTGEIGLEGATVAYNRSCAPKNDRDCKHDYQECYYKHDQQLNATRCVLCCIGNLCNSRIIDIHPNRYILSGGGSVRISFFLMAFIFISSL